MSGIFRLQPTSGRLRPENLIDYGYTFGNRAGEETTQVLPADKRALVLQGVPADVEYAFKVQAYRQVDQDIAASGLIYSAPAAPPSSPYLPVRNLAYFGDITGTIGGVPAATLVADLYNARGRVAALEIGDVTAPNVPSTLTLSMTMNLQADGSYVPILNATWTANLEADLNNYEIALKAGVAGNYTEYSAGKTSANYSWNVISATTYYCKIRAVDTSGNRSAWSTEISYIVTKDLISPAAPTGLTGDAAFNTIFLRWTNAGDADLDQVEIWENTTNSSGSATRIGTARVLPSIAGGYSRSGLPAGAVRYYWLKSVDTSGNVSAFGTGSGAITCTLVTLSDFQTGLSPISSVSSLPTAAGYTGPGIVYNTTDKQLYRYDSSIPGWTNAVPAVAVTGQITNSQIAANSVALSNFAAGLTAVEVVSSLPSTGNFQGRTIALTTDGKLYRWTSATTTGTTFWTAAVPAADVTGQLTGSQISDSSLTAAKFATGVRPVETLGSLPAAGTAGRMVFLTTDNKLYRDTGSTWITSVPTTDLTGTISTGQIAANAINTSLLATGLAVVEILGTLPVSGNFAGRTVYLTTDGKMYRYNGSAFVATVAAVDLTGQIGTSQVAPLAISTSLLADNAVSLAKLGAASVDITKFASGLTPVEIVGTLPATGNFQGRAVYLTTDNKLYRWTSATTTGTTFWSASVAAVDVVGSITGDQIPVGIFGGSNLILNGGAEVGDTSSWKISSFTTAGATFTVTTADKRTGSRSFLLTKTTLANYIGAVSKAVPVQALKSYNIKVTLRGDTAQSNGVYVRIQNYTAVDAAGYGTTAPTPDNGDLVGYSNGPASTTWTSVDQIYTPPAGTTHIAVHILNYTSAPLSLYFDDVQVFEQVGSNSISSGAITPDKFVTGTTPVETLGALPSVGNFQGRMVFLTTDNKLYRWTSTTTTGTTFWTRASDGADIVANSIVAGSFVAGAISTGDLAALAVTAAKIAANTITAGQIAANTITAGQIAANTITASQIAANTITAAQIAANTITASQIAANTISTGQIAAGAITATQIATAAITAAKVAAGAITASKITVGEANNNILDPYFIDSAYWQMAASGYGTSGYGAAFSVNSTDGLNLGKLGVPSAIRVVATGATNQPGSSLTSNTIPIPLEPNASYRFSLKWLLTAGFNGFVGYSLYIYGYDSGGTLGLLNNVGAYPVNHLSDGLTEATDRIVELDIAVAPFPGAVSAYVQLFGGWGAPASAGTLYVARPAVQRAAEGNLIVNGAITAVKIAAATITATQIASNTILAKNLVIAQRGIDIAGIEFTSNWNGSAFASNVVYATAGTINYIDNTGTAAASAIAAFSTTWSSGTLFIYWTLGQTNLSVSTSSTTAYAAGNIVVATYSGGTNLVVTYGRTIVDGSKITTGTITATQIAADTITANQIAANAITASELAAGAVTAAKITAGTITSNEIAANTILAKNLVIAQRGLDISGLEFAANWNGSAVTVNTLFWSAGTVAYVDASGASVSAAIGSSTFAWTSGTVYLYWTEGGTSISNTTTQATAQAAGNVILATYAGGTNLVVTYGRTIVDGSKILANSVTAGQIAANTITAAQIAASTITATQIAGTTITAAQIAANTITAGQIAAATITATQIAANTILAKNLVIAQRGIDVTGLQFTANWNVSVAAANYISWTAGTITYVNSSGTSVTAAISAASSLWTTGTTFVYWVEGATSLSVTTAQATAQAAGNIVMATYLGGTDMVVTYGRTVVDGSKITTGTITAAQIAANTITASQIAANTITSSQIAANTITASQIAAGTITATQIAANTVAASNLVIGQRGLDVTGIQFTANWNGSASTTNTLAWTAGSISYVNSAGTATSTAISAGTVAWTSGLTFVYWVEAAGTLSTTTVLATAYATGNIILATYGGGLNLVVTYGRTIVDGANITTGTITASQIAANTITAAQLAAGTITATQIATGTITAAQLAAGTITADRLAVGVVGTTGSSLVSNGSAESGDLSGWMIDPGFATGGTLTNTTADKNSGSRSFLLGKGTTSNLTSALSKAVAVVPGRTYAVRWSEKGPATTGWYVRMVCGPTLPANGFMDQASSGSYSDLITNSTVPSSWTSREFAWTAPAGSLWVSVLFISYTGAATTLYVDDVQMFEQTTAVIIADGAITTPKMTAGSINADRLQAATVTATQIAANTITASQIAATTITATQIAANTITAAQIAADSINASRLNVGSRGVSFKDLIFQTISGTTCTWTAGTVFWIDDTNTQQATTISSGSCGTPGGGTFYYIYWAKGATSLSFTTTAATATGPNSVHVATYSGGTNVVQIYGGTIIDGSNITTGTITATKLNVSSLDAVSGVIGLLRTSTTGARTEIEDNQLRVYDGTGVLRVRLGVW